MELSGGKAEDIALGFKDGLGGIVNASRSLMCAYKSDKWKEIYSDEDYAKKIDYADSNGACDFQPGCGC